MQGFVIVTAEAGRALRNGSHALPGSALLDGSGGFRAGERVHVVTRGRDGGQNVIATGTILCDATALHAAEGMDAPEILRDVVLLWPARG